MPRRGPLPWRANEDRALGGRGERDDVAADIGSVLVG